MVRLIEKFMFSLNNSKTATLNYILDNNKCPW